MKTHPAAPKRPRPVDTSNTDTTRRPTGTNAVQHSSASIDGYVSIQPVENSETEPQDYDCIESPAPTLAFSAEDELSVIEEQSVGSRSSRSSSRSSVRSSSSKASFTRPRCFKRNPKNDDLISANDYYAKMIKIEKKKLKLQKKQFQTMKDYYTAKLQLLSDKSENYNTSTKSNRDSFLQELPSASVIPSTSAAQAQDTQVWQTLENAHQNTYFQYN